MLLLLAGLVPHLGHAAAGSWLATKSRGQVAGAVVVVAAAVAIPVLAFAWNAPGDPSAAPPTPSAPASPAPAPSTAPPAPPTDDDRDNDDSQQEPAEDPTTSPTGSVTVAPPEQEPPQVPILPPSDPADEPADTPGAGVTDEPTEDPAEEPTEEPTEDPTEEPTEEPAPGPPAIDPFPATTYRVMPEITGTGVPDATVEILGALDQVIATTAVTANGTWSVVPESIPVAEGATFDARQIVDGEESELSTSDPVDLLAPQITNISEGDDVPLETWDVNGNGDLDDILITAVGDSGWGMQFRRNGEISSLVHEATGSPMTFVSSPQVIGESTMSVRYVDMGAGAEGAWYSVTFQVVQP